MNSNSKVVSEDAQTQLTSYSDLNYNQKQKFSYLRGVYQDEATILKLIPLIEGRGENSWKRINDKLEAIKQGDYKHQQYDDTLYDNFNIGTMYSSGDIMSIVGTVRRDCGFPAYISSIKTNCERDLFKLHIIHQKSDEVCCDDDDPTAGKMKKVIVGFTPMFRLKPED